MKFSELDPALLDRARDGENLPTLAKKPKAKKEDPVFKSAGGAEAHVRVIQSIENIPSAPLWADESQALM